MEPRTSKNRHSGTARQRRAHSKSALADLDIPTWTYRLGHTSADLGQARDRRAPRNDGDRIRILEIAEPVGHVWTAPAVQEESDYQRSVRVRSCIRPLNAAVCAAGPDV